MSADIPKWDISPEIAERVKIAVSSPLNIRTYTETVLDRMERIPEHKVVFEMIDGTSLVRGDLKERSLYRFGSAVAYDSLMAELGNREQEMTFDDLDRIQMIRDLSSQGKAKPFIEMTEWEIARELPNAFLTKTRAKLGLSPDKTWFLKLLEEQSPEFNGLLKDISRTLTITQKAVFVSGALIPSVIVYRRMGMFNHLSTDSSSH